MSISKFHLFSKKTVVYCLTKTPLPCIWACLIFSRNSSVLRLVRFFKNELEQILIFVRLLFVSGSDKARAYSLNVYVKGKFVTFAKLQVTRNNTQLSTSYEEKKIFIEDLHKLHS